MRIHQHQPVTILRQDVDALEPLCFRLPAPADAGPAPRVSDAASWEAALDAHLAATAPRIDVRMILTGVYFQGVDEGEVVIAGPWDSDRTCTMVTQLIGEELLPAVAGAPVRLVHA